MEETRTAEQCDQCKESFEMLVKDLEPLLKDDLPVLCPDCETKIIDEQTEAEKPPKRCFEYEVVSRKETDFDYLGQNGWRLVAVDNGLAYFEREIFIEES